MSLTTDMKTLIPLVVATQTDIYRDDMPDLDNIIGIYQTGGFDSSHSFNQVEFEEPTFQIMIRNKVSDTAISKAEAIKNALDGQTNLTINSNLYLSIFLQGDILPLGKDDKNRTEVSLNFRVRVKRA